MCDLEGLEARIGETRDELHDAMTWVSMRLDKIEDALKEYATAAKTGPHAAAAALHAELNS